MTQALGVVVFAYQFAFLFRVVGVAVRLAAGVVVVGFAAIAALQGDGGQSSPLPVDLKIDA
ncbi:hypothetical protein ACO0LG_10915 [Undibacterium sp. Ji42W]|uniref:hypothetical protein n=1 Tax=Undibacterium sp. Ji42W TaxID=3413039 RepID=UPI003BF07FFE